jgi:hypothetical protein
MYILASETPLRPPGDGGAVRALPDAVRADLAEWIPPARLEPNLQEILARRVTRGELEPWRPAFTRLTDDFPVNEYYWVRAQGSALARLAVSRLGPPPTMARLLGALYRRAAAEPADALRRDPDFALYDLARTLRRADVALEALERLATRHDNPVIRDITAQVTQSYKDDHSGPWN